MSAAVSRPRISVVVPTRDRAGYIKDCVPTILANAELFELLVIDQSADDSTERALKPFAHPKLRYVYSDQRGVTNGRNLGMELSTGDAIAFTDDDCRAPPDWVSQIAGLFEKDPEASIICGRVLIPAEQGEGMTTSFEPVVREWQGRYPPVDRDWGITANFALRRDVLNRIGPFDPVLGAGAPLRSGGEPDFIFRALRAGMKVVNAKEVQLSHFHTRAEGEASKKLLSNYGSGTAAAFLKHVRMGDLHATAIYFKHLTGCMKLMLNNAAHLRRPLGIGYTLAFLEGSMKSLSYRIDKKRRLYVPH
jgi:glycosyltransferase involved in cell wall biosynthesis